MFKSFFFSSSINISISNKKWKKIHDMIYHGGYKYLRIPYLFLKQKICISNKK
jgi:hypothetical protein